MKRMMVVVICVMLAGCSALQTFAVNNKGTIDAAANYYAEYAGGVKTAMAVLSVIPGTAKYFQVAQTAVGLLDDGVALMQKTAALAQAGVPATADEVAKQQANVYGVVQVINDTIGKIKAAQAPAGV